MLNFLSVSELVDSIKNTVENNFNLKNTYVKGEVSRVVYQSSGHIYFTLKDNNSSIDCTLWKSYASNLQFKLEEGMNVIVLGSPSIYKVRGSLQFNSKDVICDGQGALYIALEQLKNKLSSAGLFNINHKKEIPLYPEKIGIISGKNAAGLKDVISIIKRRWPLATINFYESLVQGANAPKSLIKALNIADNDDNDVLLLVRGGGSIEDLWCFNDEELAYTIFNLKTCIVTGIGHEIDFTIAEMVADKRASTPSAAAELITPNIEEINDKLNNIYKLLIINIQKQILNLKNKLELLKKNKIFSDSKNFLFENYRQNLIMNINSLIYKKNYTMSKKIKLNQYKYTLITNSNNLINNHKLKNENYKNTIYNSEEKLLNNYYNSLNNYIIKLDSLSPLKTLKRGFSVIKKDNKIIKDIDKINKNDTINIILSNGCLDAKVIKKEVKNEQ